MLYSPYNLLGIIILVLDVIAIVGVIGGSSPPDRKALWTILILLLPLVGMVLYYLMGRTRQDATPV